MLRGIEIAVVGEHVGGVVEPPHLHDVPVVDRVPGADEGFLRRAGGFRGEGTIPAGGSGRVDFRVPPRKGALLRRFAQLKKVGVVKKI